MTQKNFTSFLGTLDPGKHHAGLAKFQNDLLVACKLIQSARSDPGECAKDLAEQAHDFYGYLDEFVYEFPRVYAQRKSKGDNNDLLYLPFTAGAVNAVILAEKRALVEPHTWKGNIDADIMTTRIYNKLDPLIERPLVPTVKEKKSDKRTPEHNVVDAVGIGLYRLMRMG